MKDRKVNQVRIVMAAWICITGAFLCWLEVDTWRVERLLAQNTAKAFFQQVLVSRRWNAAHGGVYVPITPQTQPNPYLPSPGRDLTADNGLRLTLINPSYMTRQLAELAREYAGGVQINLSSLRPIRPANRATGWEANWLKTFEQGVEEQGEFFQDGDITWFRYMAPLTVEADCLNCHDQQGYKVGDICGGISVSMPFPSHTHFQLLIGYGLVAGSGLLLIFLGGIIYERKRRLFQATFNSPVPTCVTDKNFMILTANESYWAEFGPLPTHRKTIKCYAHRPGKSCHTEDCPLTRVMNGAEQYAYEVVKELKGAVRHFIVNAKPLFDHRGKVVGCVESFQEITERKRSEQALEAVNRQLEALSNTDGLTGIANRRHFDEVLGREYARHARSGKDLSLVLLDIDHFKSFNDYYGHVKGDECLHQVAQVINQCASRPADLAARYGGEEFACILPETDRRGAIAVAESIRQAIIARAIPHQASKVADCVTASLGGVTVRCSADGSAGGVVARADRLLYQAKASGRNRVEFEAPREIDGEIKEKVVQLVWQESFCCGNPLLDAQHQALFDGANELLAAVLVTPARPEAEISAIISRLLEEVGQHFQDEEAMLARISFPGLSKHQAEHAELLARGHEIAEEFKAATLTVGAVFQFLAHEMVMRHMLEADLEYFPFVAEAGAGTPEPGR